MHYLVKTMIPKIFKINRTPDPLSSIIMGLKQTSLTPLISFGLILAMAFAIFLVVTFYILEKNKNTLNDKWNASAEISLYLKKKISLKDAGALVTKLQSNPVIAKVELIQPREGMKAFMESTALNTLLSSFKENPLPSVIIVLPKIKFLSEDMLPKFIRELKELPEIETVKADADWMNRSYHWLNLVNHLSSIFILILSLNALLIIGGASYIMAQLLALKNNTHKIILQYQFAWYGLISSLLALLWTRVLVITLQNKDVLLQGLSLGCWIFIVVFSVFLCLVSARIGAK
jgi:cell division transport system permease protein